MMLIRHFAFALALLGTHAISSANSIEFDVDGARVVVVRPIDRWSGNTASSEYSMKEYSKKKIAFFYIDADGKKRVGSSGLFSAPQKGSLGEAVQSELSQFGFTNNGPSGVAFTVEKEISLSPEKTTSFLQAQKILYQKTVIDQGDPSTLSERIGNKRIFGTILAIAATGYGMEKLGAVSGSQFVFGSGLAGDISKLSKDEAMAISSVPPIDFDPIGYSVIDVRKVINGSDRVGQIIIAYKGEKSLDVEQKALARAIVVASGADSSSEKISTARQTELSDRQLIWNSCIANDNCANK